MSALPCTCANGHGLPHTRRELCAPLVLVPPPGCNCESCMAVREYRYGATCCPRGLTHGALCICGAVVRAAG